MCMAVLSICVKCKKVENGNRPCRLANESASACAKSIIMEIQIHNECYTDLVRGNGILIGAIVANLMDQVFEDVRVPDEVSRVVIAWRLERPFAMCKKKPMNMEGISTGMSISVANQPVGVSSGPGDRLRRPQ